MNFRTALPELSVRRPVSVLMILLALSIFGIISLFDIPLQMMPSGFDPPYMWVWIPYPDGTPAETDARIVQPVQEQLATVPGLKRISSRANLSSAGFSLEFHQSVDLDEAYNSVADRMERAMAGLPDDVQDYGIWRFDPSDQPIVWAGVAIDPAIEDPHALMTQVVQRRLERVAGVAKVEVWGTDEKVVWIDFDREALFAHGVDLGSLVGRLAGDNIQVSGGRLEEGGRLRYVRSLARWEGVEDLRRIPIGRGLVLDDVAEVRLRAEKSTAVWHIDGKEAVGIGITKESSANTVETATAVREALDELEKDPRLAGMDFSVFFDQGLLIQDSVDSLGASTWQGALFAVAVLLLFLREWRMTLIIAAGIPITLVMTVSALWATGGSLNLLSLLGLMLGVGMVVDNAIVVVETIQRRRQEGMSPVDAAISGTAEVNLAITLSTLTAMVVFLPVILMSEDATFSFFMGELGFPVVFAQGASLFVALITTPLATVWMKDADIKPDPRWVIWLTGHYRRWLTWVLERRLDTGLGALAFLVLTFALPARLVSCGDSAEGNLNDFQVRFEVDPTFTWRQRLAAVESIEDVLEEGKEKWQIRVSRSNISTSSNRGTVYVYLDEDVAPEERSRIRKEVLAAIPERAGVTLSSGGSEDPSSKNTVSLTLRGEDPDVLHGLGLEALRRVRAAPGVLSAELDDEGGGPQELRLHVDRDVASRYGLNAQGLGQTLAFALRGAPLPDLADGDRHVSVHARFEAEDRADMDVLLDFPAWSPLTGAAVPLRALTELEVSPGMGNINRDDGRVGLTLNAELEEGLDLVQGVALVQGAVAEMEFPRGYGVDGFDVLAEQEANDQARNLALLLSVVFVFLIMGMLFESLLLPMAIITTVPMAMLGVWWGLWATGTSLDVMGGVGLIILVGVVVNNGIVLIDTVGQLREEGNSRTEALVIAGERRLRPILMTALCSVAGVVPTAFGSATFIGIPYAPLGRVIGFGLASATVLTLFFVPYLYAALDDLREWAALVRRGPPADAPQRSPS